MFLSNFHEWLEIRESNERGVQDMPRQGDIIINRPSALFSKVLTRNGKRRDYKPREEDINMSAFRVGEVGETSATAKSVVNQRHARPVQKQFRTGKLLDASDLFGNTGRKVFIYDPHGRWLDMLNQALGKYEELPPEPSPSVEDLQAADEFDLDIDPQGDDPLQQLEPPELDLDQPELDFEPLEDEEMESPLSGEEDALPDMNLAACHNPAFWSNGMFWKTYTETKQYEKFPTY
jgi:hypothetical protein